MAFLFYAWVSFILAIMYLFVSETFLLSLHCLQRTWQPLYSSVIFTFFFRPGAAEPRPEDSALPQPRPDSSDSGGSDQLASAGGRARSGGLGEGGVLSVLSLRLFLSSCCELVFKGVLIIS